MTKQLKIADSERRVRGPSPKKTAATRERIEHAALRVFIDKGYGGARMADVALAADVAKGTLYLHFSTKALLFEGVLRAAAGSTVQRLTAIEASLDETMEARLRATLRPLAELLDDRDRNGIFRLVIVEGPQFPEMLETYRKTVLEPLTVAVRNLAHGARRSGELDSDALERVPTLLLSPGLLAIVWNDLFPEQRQSPTDIFDAFLDLVFRHRGIE